MEVGDWRATRDLNDLYREIRSLGEAFAWLAE